MRLRRLRRMRADPGWQVARAIPRTRAAGPQARFLASCDPQPVPKSRALIKRFGTHESMEYFPPSRGSFFPLTQGVSSISLRIAWELSRAPSQDLSGQL